MLIEETEQSAFLMNPQLVRLMNPGTTAGGTRKLSELASLSYPSRFRRKGPRDPPPTTSYDFTDKRFGIIAIHELPEEAPLSMDALPSGAIAFGRIRPYLANIGVVPYVAGGLVVSNSEWIIVQHKKGWNHLLCAALRSKACLSQVHATSGQTRPRISIEALAEMNVPWPFTDAEAQKLEAEIAAATETRRRADEALARAQAMAAPET